MRTNSKIFVAGSNATTVTSLTASVDTKGFSFARLIFFSTSTGTASSAVTAVKLEESDDNTTFATISGFVSGTDFTVSAVTNSTANGKVYFGVDLRGRKRYLKATAQHDTGGVGEWVCELSSPANGMNTAAELGAHNIAGNY